MSDAVYATANTLPKQINEMAIRIQKMVGKKPDKFDELVSEYYGILVDIGTSLSITVEAKENAGDVTSIRDLTNLIVTRLKSDGAVKQKLSDENLQKLYDFFVKYEDAIKPVESGLPKSGTNNCFMNATLQMFYHIPEVKNAVLKLDPVSKEQKEIRSAFEMLNGNKRQGELSCSLVKGLQHDAHEYIMSDFVPAVLDALKPIFYTQLKTEGNDEKGEDQALLGVSILQPNGEQLVGEVKLSDLIRAGQVESIAEGSTIKKYTYIPNTNTYLLVHLLRFKNDSTKISDVLTVDPNEMITLNENPKAENKVEYKYKLRGLIEHIGKSRKSGHYVYHWLNESGVWYTFDDSTAKPRSETTSPTLGNGYIYLYKRVTAGSESVNPIGATPAAAVNPIKLMVYYDNGVKTAHGFISEKKPDIIKIGDREFVERLNDKDYKPHWWLDVAHSGSNNEGFQELVNKQLTPDAKTATVEGIEYEIVNQSYLKKAEGGRRRTHKNRRRITKRKNKTKKH